MERNEVDPDAIRGADERFAIEAADALVSLLGRADRRRRATGSRVSRTATEEDGATGLVVGIDAGGTSTRARAVRHRQIVHEATSGPGNPLAVDSVTMEASYHAALADCPPPAHVAACVAGAGGQEEQGRIAELLMARFPGAQVRVEPDFVAALLAAPAGTDVCVIAGTGSVICSATDGGFAVSGGQGWILGDHGFRSASWQGCAGALRVRSHSRVRVVWQQDKRDIRR